MRALGGGSDSEKIITEIEDGQGDEADGEMDLMEFINYILRSSFDHDPKSAMYKGGGGSKSTTQHAEYPPNQHRAVDPIASYDAARQSQRTQMDGHAYARGGSRYNRELCSYVPLGLKVLQHHFCHTGWAAPPRLSRSMPIQIAQVGFCLHAYLQIWIRKASSMASRRKGATVKPSTTSLDCRAKHNSHGRGTAAVRSEVILSMRAALCCLVICAGAGFGFRRTAHEALPRCDSVTTGSWWLAWCWCWHS
jgi:hypothetical protein